MTDTDSTAERGTDERSADGGGPTEADTADIYDYWAECRRTDAVGRPFGGDRGPTSGW